ncbi:hypothetical protein Pla22_03080 [Rubripirellula amarantea]|uniref:Uncharacterized protein n=1 Tax=Rubripirellula amarantea TaxID=2527999 RepID=A0A5C5WSD0_9BACT|nr:hypothetical protein [Rubripirellula amarantea]TWT52682.1 hypothetical protein Pla22_03080 [Rubripirellula amarantea]
MENPYLPALVDSSNSSVETSESLDRASSDTLEACGCSRSHRVMKWALGTIVVALLLFNATLYASPSLSQQIGKFIPDSLAGNLSGLEGHNRGCPCESHCVLEESEKTSLDDES